jgi:cellulose synthase/poly-beta-1,6-N-acetylglucosamine synthase-like glycosyltransferase
MLFYSILFIFLTFLYAVALLKLQGGFKNLKAGQNKTQPNVSVVIAARNEEDTIGCCLAAVLNQTYPKHKLEIIVIDDRSEDGTFEAIQKLAGANGQIKLLQIKDRSAHLAPKKRAIDLGIQNASGEIIVTTDADCQPGPEWISKLIKHFEPNVGMVAGFNPYKTENPSLFYQMLSLDYFAMASVAAASAGLNYPLSCTGGNLAYRKTVYLETGGFTKFSNWVSGDDDFFLEQIRENSNWEICYATNPKTSVPTAPPETFKDFVQQRIRYASKAGHYSPKVTLGLVGIYLMNLLILIGPILSIVKPQILLVWLTGWAFKTLSEFIFLKRGEKKFQTKFKSTVFLLAAVMHPIYIVLAGLLGQVSNFSWKGVEYSARTTQNAQTIS